MKIPSLIISCFVVTCMSSPAFAESPRRGLVTSGSCPLSCEDLGVPLVSCKEWSAGARCFVEDMRSPAGHRSVAIVPKSVAANTRIEIPSAKTTNPVTAESEVAIDKSIAIDSTRRGLITSSSCPYSCADAGVPQDVCREAKQGTRCTVEDLRYGPGHRSAIKVPN